MNLTLCIFAPYSFALDGVTSFVITQGDRDMELLPAGPSSSDTVVVESCVQDGAVCALEMPLDESLYGDNQTSFVASGVAKLRIDANNGGLLRRSLAVRAEMDFSAEITLETKPASAVVDNGQNGNSDGGDGDGPSSDLGKGDGKVVSWLFPLLALLFVAGICVYMVVNKRNNQPQGGHSVI